jgi:hypothetical protein
MRVQCENGAWPSTFIATGGTPESRAGDAVEIAIDAAAPWYNPAEGTLYVAAEFVTDPAVLVTAQTAQFVVIFNDGTNDNLVGSTNRNGNFNSLTSLQRTGGSEHVRLNSAIPPAMGRHAFATGWRSGDSAMAIDGFLAEVTTNDPFDAPLISRLDIGRNSAGPSENHLYGFIRQVAYWPRRLPDLALSASSMKN